MGKTKTKVVLEAVVTRADGTVEDLGVISRSEADDIPDWFKQMKESDNYKRLEQEGVIENG